jgi:hypothetical protein
VDQDSNTISMMFKCILTNASETKTIYLQVRRGQAFLQGKANPDPKLNAQVVALLPKTELSVQIAAVHNIDLGAAASGVMEVEVLYGPRRDKLKYLLSYETAPVLTFGPVEEATQRIPITFVAPVRKYEHGMAWHVGDV